MRQGIYPTGELSYRWYVLNPTAGGLPTTYSIMDRGCQNRGENFHDNSTTSNHDVIFQHGRGSQHMSFAWCAIRSSTVVLMGSFAMNIEMQLLCVAAVCAAYCSVLQLCQLVDIAQLLYCCTCGVMSKFKSRDLCHGIYHPAPHITHEGTELRASTLNMGDLQIGHNPNRCPQTKTVKRGRNTKSKEIFMQQFKISPR